MKKYYPHLYVQVLIAISLGILIGTYFPETGEKMKPLGDGFIKLIKMMIAPIIFCTIVTGIASMGSIKQIGRVGGKALIYFEILTSISLIIGLMAVHIIQPGAGMHVNTASLDSSAIKVAPAMHLSDFLMNIIPSTIVSPFVTGDILQVVFLSILTGIALSLIGDSGKAIIAALTTLSQLLFKIISIIMLIAPLGAFGAMAYTISKYGIGTLASLGQLMATFYLTCIIFVFGVLGIICKLCGVSIWKFLAYIRDELLIVLGTSSSEAGLPGMMRKMEALGCSKSIVGLVIPTGYSFNLDGSCIYFTIAAIFIAQATGTPLTMTQELTMLGILLLTSKGAAGVTGSGFITLAATLSSTHLIPVAGLTLILGIDRFMSEARAITNIIGNGVATIVIAKWEGELDGEKVKAIS